MIIMLNNKKSIKKNIEWCKYFIFCFRLHIKFGFVFQKENAVITLCNKDESNRKLQVYLGETICTRLNILINAV